VSFYCLIQGMVNPILFNPGLAMFALMLALTYVGMRKPSIDDLTS